VKVIVNGEPLELADGCTVSDAAAEVGIQPRERGVAVALDGEVVPRTLLDSTVLSEGQRVEIVAAIQGGAL
jgi:sulfur carrier protein